MAAHQIIWWIKHSYTCRKETNCEFLPSLYVCSIPSLSSLAENHYVISNKTAQSILSRIHVKCILEMLHSTYWVLSIQWKKRYVNHHECGLVWCSSMACSALLFNKNWSLLSWNGVRFPKRKIKIKSPNLTVKRYAKHMILSLKFTVIQRICPFPPFTWV